MSTSPNDRTFNGVQALRFFAALLVVVTHATGMATERMLGMGPGHFWYNGQSGVDIFFVISGFVMALSSTSLEGRADGWRTFAKRRILRVVPMYWIATTLKVVMVLALPAMALHSHFDPLHITNSYLFLPSYNEDGEVLPVLTVGWTLQFEMFFYAMFTLALLFKRPPLVFCGLVFLVLSTVGSLVAHPAGVGAIWSYTSPIILEFIYGMIIARFLCKPRMPVWLGALIAVAGFAVLMGVHTLVAWRPYMWGIPAAMVVLGVVQMERAIGAHLPKWLLEQGNASYVLYLFHPFLVPAVGVILIKAHIISLPLAVVACLVASPLMALVIHRVIENPLNRWLKNATSAGGMLRRKAASYGG